MKRRLIKITAVFLGLAALTAVTAVLIVRSAWFADYVRRRIVEEAERATGARVELGRFQFDWTLMQARVDGFVIHGREEAGEAPLVRVESVVLGLRIISVLEKQVDLASLRVLRPEVNIIVYPDGSTNFPGPSPRAGGRSWSEAMINLKVQQYEIENGVLEYDHRRANLNLRGQNLRIRMSYDSQTPGYTGEFASDAMRITPPGFTPLDTDVTATFVLARDRVHFSRLHIETEGMQADLTGDLEDLRTPRGTLNVKATASVAEGVRLFRLPVDPVGSARLNGTVAVSFERGFDYTIAGAVNARGVRFRLGPALIQGAGVQGNAQISREGLVLRQMQASALGAQITGEASIEKWREIHVEGNIASLSVARAANSVTDRPIAWDGVLAGPFRADVTILQRNAVVRANLGIAPLAGAEPVEGHLDLTFDQAADTLALGSSSIVTRASRLEAEGTLGQTLRVRLRTTDLNDLLPAIAMWNDQAPAELPLSLNNGSVNLDGRVTGALNDPHFQGQAALVNGIVQGYSIDRWSGDIDASRRQVLSRSFTATRGQSEAAGSISLTARPGSAAGGFADAEMTAQMTLRNLNVAELAREAGIAREIEGLASAGVRVSGSVQRPEFGIDLDVRNPAAFGERIDRLRAGLNYLPGSLQVSNGVATDGGSEVRFAGTYRHTPGNWRTGDISFDATTQNLPARRVERIARFEPPTEATINGRLHAEGRVENGSFTLAATNADLSARGVTVAGQRLGDFTITAETRGIDLRVNAGGTVLDSIVEANGAWRLEGDAPGTATLRFTRLPIDSLHKLVMLGRDATQPPPFEGFIQGGARLSVPLENLPAFRAEVTLDQVRVNPRPNQVLRLGVQPGDVILQNSQPVLVDLTRNEATVRSARFTGRDTSMSLTGRVPLRGNGGADLAVNGNINLIILQLLNPDLLAQGNAAVQATIRGNLQDPDLGGRLELSNASLYFGDLPNGVDNVGGSIRFDRRRATIEKLSAETGGGRVDFNGFVEFGTVPVYRLQARATGVRVRYPENVSTTSNATLSLNGTSQASTLSGTVTVNRAALNLNADLGQLLSQFSQSPAAPEDPNAYLRGMQMDVRVQSGSNFQLETSLTRDVEADINLRLRGSALRPVVLGIVSINRGEVNVFGNRYAVDRGEIRFVNPVRLEPSFDMDLSTRARGITVNISFSGTMQRPNVNFSSDPPLQTAEIVALLAVGRDPALGAAQTAPGVGSGSGSASFVQASGGLLGQAASAQLNSRLQRFFGATRVKIDPTLTGVDNLPQARLTFEQQVSKDITLTYITNLNRATEQVVRIQWDLSREWSAIAVRDQNGLFGVDFQFRKRFK